MSNNKVYAVRVDEDFNWTPTRFRKVDLEELDRILKVYGNTVKDICSRGSQGAMTMWAYFKSRIDSGCYSDMINAYSLLSNDNKSLVDREHELRHAFEQYKELWAIRYFGSLENYFRKKASEAEETLKKYGGND
jgi:hypothetical protein